MLAFLRERLELSYTGAWIHLYAAETGSVYVNKVSPWTVTRKLFFTPTHRLDLNSHICSLSQLPQETGESQLDEPEEYTLNEDTIVAHAICFHFSVCLRPSLPSCVVVTPFVLRVPLTDCSTPPHPHSAVSRRKLLGHG
jgi:hypothetical protein